MQKYIIYLILICTTNLFSQAMNEPLIKIKQISAEESYHLISTYNFGLVAVDSAKKIIDFCSHHLDEQYQLRGHENIYLNIHYADRSLNEIDLRKGCQVILNHIIDSLNLKLIKGKYQKGLKIRSSNISTIISSNKNSKGTAIISFEKDFVFLQLYYLFDILFVQPIEELAIQANTGFSISMDDVKDCRGDIRAVQQLLKQYGLMTEMVDIPVTLLE